MEVAQIAQDPTLAGHLCASLPYIRAEVVYAVRFEMARTVIDVLSRRTRSLLLERDEAMGAAQSVAALMAAELGWDSDEIVAQVDAFIALAEHERDALPAL
jgi:glycerol-3-phosphate dehydrogenase